MEAWIPRSAAEPALAIQRQGRGPAAARPLPLRRLGRCPCQVNAQVEQAERLWCLLALEELPLPGYVDRGGGIMG